MGYFFTILYLITAYLTPAVVFGSLSEYHVEIVVVLLAIIASLPNLIKSGLLRSPQGIALCGLAFAIMASVLQSGWLGGAASSLYGFLQPAVAFIFVAVNFKKKSHFTLLSIIFIAASTFYIYMGLQDLHESVTLSPYLYTSHNLSRLRGLGFVNDPNDFAQVLVALIPCIFLWKTRVFALNIFLLGIPLSALLVGMYFTHSRGAMVALVAVILFISRRKIGTIPASFVAMAVGAALFAIGWSGGRDVSTQAGSDRLELWSDGLTALKAHPVFGIGLNGFVDTYGLTAHNSVVICVTELGVVGLFFWILLINSSIFDIFALWRTKKLDVVGTPLLSENVDLPESHIVEADFTGKSDYSEATSDIRDSDYNALLSSDRDAIQITQLLMVSLVGMLTAGWFISRALSMWLFMYLGMIYAAVNMGTSIHSFMRTDFPRVFKWSAFYTLAAVCAVYVILRTSNILNH